MRVNDFSTAVNKIVANIPRGRLMTYGQIAAMAGKPRAARLVGQIAHFGDLNLPWHRVVNAKGGLAAGFVPGGRVYQAKLLAMEDIEIQENFKVKDLKKYLWRPTK